MNFSQNPGIYIHIPFCQSKCGYCDFYSVTESDLRAVFLENLRHEVSHYAASGYSEQSFDTVYLGGGTPSILTAGELEDLLGHIFTSFQILPGSEITLEVNPGTVDRNKLRKIRRLGINRLSIGVQSFNDKELAQLERIHSAQEAKSCIETARECGFDNLSLDLIYALPAQKISSWKKNMDDAIAFNPEHISAYNLNYEPDTPFFAKLQRGEFKRHSEESEVIFFDTTQAHFRAAGYVHYEVSNYCDKACNISRHNYKYWNHTPYLGFGPAAHSFWAGKRWSNARSIRMYIDKLANKKMPVSYSEKLKSKDLIFEYIFLRLRTSDGLDLRIFSERFHKDFNTLYADKIKRLVNEGYALVDAQQFRLSQKGMLICDEILPVFADV